MCKLFLKKDLVTSKDITEKGVLAYAAISKLMSESIVLINQTETQDCISCNRMAYALLGYRDKYDKYLITALYQGLYELDLVGAIKILHNIGSDKQGEFILELKDAYLNKEKEYFTVIEDWEVRKILNNADLSYAKRISLLRYFIGMIGTFNNSSKDYYGKGKIGHMSIEYIAEQGGTSASSGKRYNAILQDMKLIYIYKTNDKMLIDGRLKQIKNTYSRYADMDLCISFGEDTAEHGIQHRIVKTNANKKQADEKRKLGQYYHLMYQDYKEGKPCRYSDDIVKEVYKYIINSNRTLNDTITEKEDACKKQGYVSSSDQKWIDKLKYQIRTVDLFEQFDFLKDVKSQNGESDVWGEPNPMEKDYSVEEILEMPTVGGPKLSDDQILDTRLYRK